MKQGVFAIRPQDVLVLLNLLVPSKKDSKETQMEMAQAVGLSQAEVMNALNRLRNVGLVDHQRKKPQRLAAFEFLTHALKFLLPPRLGTLTRGVPTAHSAPPLKGRVLGEYEIVWPSELGESRGMALEPFSPTVPIAAKRNPELHQLLALVDSLRMGRRERKLAETELRKRILSRHPEAESEV